MIIITLPPFPAGSGEALLAVRIAFLDHVQNLQMHAVRAKFHIGFSLRILDHSVLPEAWHSNQAGCLAHVQQ